MIGCVHVAICDRHAFYRKWLREQLTSEPDIEVTGEASDGEEAVRLVKESLPDVLLIELATRTMPGVEAGRIARESVPDLRVIVLAASEEEAGLARLAAIHDGGADGCLLTDAEPGEVAAAVRRVSEGKWVSARALSAPLFQESLDLLRRAAERSATCPRCGHTWSDGDPLSPREREILRLVALGWKNRAIAHSVGLAEGTVKNHVARLLRKLELGSRLEAAVYAAKEGIV